MNNSKPDLIDLCHSQFTSLSYGYVATIQKTQRVTIDNTHVLATPGLDRHSAYVALCRHWKVIQFMLKRWNAFTLFLNDGHVCLSHNFAERAVRSRSGAKSWLFYGSDPGTNEHGETFIWAVWPYQRLGNVGSALNVIDARMKAEKTLTQSLNSVIVEKAK